MSPALRLAAFVALLVLVAAAAALAGWAVPPVHDEPPAPAHGVHDDDAGAPAGTHHDDGTSTMTDAVHAPAGLALTAGGHTLTPAITTLAPSRAADYRFRVLGPDGAALRDFDLEHERRMHLIVVRRDLHGFHHLHPQMAADGTWSVTLPPLAAGAHRVFADFAVADAGRTLGADLLVGAGRRGPHRLLPGHARRPGARGRRRGRVDLPRHPGGARGRQPAALPGRARSPGRAPRG